MRPVGFPFAVLLVGACSGSREYGPGVPGAPHPAAPVVVPVATIDPIETSTDLIAAEEPPEEEPPAPQSPWAIPLPTSTPAPPPPPDLSQYARWRQKRVITVGQSHLQVSALSPDDRHALVVGQLEFAVRIYERETGKLAWRHALPGYEVLDRVDAVFWPDLSHGLRFVMAGKDGVTLRDAATGAVVERVWPELTWSVGWSPDERVLVASRSFLPEQRTELTFLVRSADDTLREVARLPTEHRVDDWALSADNRYLVTIGYPSNRVELHRLDTGALLWSVPAPRYAGGVAISAHGERVAVGGEHLLLLDAQQPERRAAYHGFGNNIDTVTFSRGGDAVLASSYDGRIRIFRNDVESATLTLIQELRHAGTANVYGLSLLRDGSGMVSASGDRTLRWWGR